MQLPGTCTVLYLVITKLVVSTKQDFAFHQQEVHFSHLSLLIPVKKITVPSGTSAIVPVTWLVLYEVQLYISVAVLSSRTKCKYLVLVLYCTWLQYNKTCRKHKARFHIPTARIAFKSFTSEKKNCIWYKYSTIVPFTWLVQYRYYFSVVVLSISTKRASTWYLYCTELGYNKTCCKHKARFRIPSARIAF